ncbi:hypothetical protein EON65_02595 [archaeon]|nr:MAG: hypothetical protein EON65_02595 [archaeon]
MMPKPITLVVKQAEMLLCFYRADFLMGLSKLTSKGHDDGFFRVVLIIIIAHAAKALRLIDIYAVSMFLVMQAPKVS